MHLLAILVALLAVVVKSERMSGLYVDNGLDQTVMHRVMTLRQKREVEHDILDLLEIPEPSSKSYDPSVRSSRVKHSAPKFLLDIYNNELESKSRDISNSDFDLDQNADAISQSDAIMTFPAQSNQVLGDMHHQGMQLWFDVSKVPEYEHILDAELRIYRSLEASKNRGPFTLSAYRILRLEDTERKLKYIDSANVSSVSEGWVKLNVSEALHHWLQDPSSNQGLYLSVHSSDRQVSEMKPEDIGFGGVGNGVERESFMVAFFKSADLRQHSTRKKRGIQRHKRSNNDRFDFGSNPYIEPQMPRWSQRSCQIRTLYVNFRDLNWEDRIIAPDGYDANYCSGECNFPLNAHMNATNHAIVQSFMHLRFPGRVPKPCCAPTKLSPLSVIYYVDDKNVILKKYKSMVVKNCGCH